MVSRMKPTHAHEAAMHRPVLLYQPPAPVSEWVQQLQRDVGGAAFDRLKPVRRHMYHCTALAFVRLVRIEPLLDRICQIVAGLELESFYLGFNKFASFERWGGLNGVAAGVGDAAARRKTLVDAMWAAGLGDQLENGKSRPHMTLFHNSPPLGSHPIAPIGWRVSQLVLIRSHHGFGRHEEIARWPLSSPRQGELFH